MKSTLKTYRYDNGEIQRVQWAEPDSWDEIDFFKPVYSSDAFRKICNLYENYIVPKCPWIFPRMILFTLPEGESNVLKTAEEIRKGVRVSAKERLHFADSKVRETVQSLIGQGCLKVVCGKCPWTKVLPVDKCIGFMSECEKEAKLKVNSNFFIMDCFDVASKYDTIGTPLGLCVKDGLVLNPPLFDREALLIYENGESKVCRVSLSKLKLRMGGKLFEDGKNCTFFSRPEYAKTPGLRKTKSITETVIVGNKVLDVVSTGKTQIPASGFVVRFADDCDVKVGDTVIYEGLENVKFGIQVGNSIMADGRKTLGFNSKFFNIYRFYKETPFPPSLYPLDFDNARAARIAIGATKDGKPVILWAEGAGKLKYVPGEDSCGASLKEMAMICEDLRLENAVNLDGGGSAQILFKGKRDLLITDRNTSDNSEAERAVPLGLIVR